MRQILLSPSQLFRRNEPTEPTHICYVFRLTTNRGPIIPKFECSLTSGVLFRVRSYLRHAGETTGMYTCELYVPANGSPEISDPLDLAFCVAARFYESMLPLYKVELIRNEDYSHFHSYDTDPDTCFNYIP